MMDIQTLWTNNLDSEWREQEKHYDDRVKPQNRELEARLENYSIENIRKMTVKDFYEFLYNEYFVWKFTDGRILAKNRKLLTEQYQHCEAQLEQVLKDLSAYTPAYDRDRTAEGFEILTRIAGVSFIAASGLLSLLYPRFFGTFDKFVEKQLVAAGVLHEGEVKITDLKIDDAVYLTAIMEAKAEELNSANHTDYWTPRKIDRVLWCLR